MALVVDRVAQRLGNSPEFTDEVAGNVMLVVSAVVRFLAARLNYAKPYMRESGKGDKAVEEDLQEDLFDWLQSGALLQGVPVFEPQRVGNGRADISVTFINQQVVNELKREQRDSSREAIQATYSEQAGSYDATGYPFGLVTVLDVSAPPPMTPRLEECVWVHEMDQEGGRRWLVFIRVPGRLLTPSEHTKRASRKK